LITKYRTVLGPDGKENPKVTLTLTDNKHSIDIPKQYTLNFIDRPNSHTYAFSENGRGIGVALEGQVEHEATLQPLDQSEYARIMRTRQEKAQQPTRQIKMLDESEEKVHSYLRGNRNDKFLMSSKKKVLQQAQKDSKPQRLPRNDLLDLLFKLFEDFEYWNMKGLLEQTQQPQVWLREVLNEIAVLNKRGPYTGMYQLKPEFRFKNDTAITFDPNVPASDPALAPTNTETNDNIK